MSIVFVYFVTDSVRKLLDTPSYAATHWSKRIKQLTGQLDF